MLTESRYKAICTDFGLNPDSFKMYQKGIYKFSEKYGDEGVNAICQMFKSFKNFGRVDTYPPPHRNVEKILFSKDKKQKGVVIDYHTLEGVKLMYEYLQDGWNVVTFLRSCGSIEINRTWDTIWEGDVWMTDDWGKQKAVLAKVDDNGHAYFKNLLWTDEYGFLRPDGNPFEHGDKIMFNEIGNNKNSYAIRLGKNQRLLCNAFIDDLAPLMPNSKVRK